MTSDLPRISLVIPATQTDIHYLPGLLQKIMIGRDRPDEVVVSLSNAHEVSAAVKRKVEESGSSFEQFQLLRHPYRMKGGDNRQAGFERTTHDVISFFDADDIPHPDRVAVLRRLFAQRDIMHLCHCHVPFNRDVVSDEQLSLFSPIPDDIDRFIIGPDCISQAYFPNRDLMECLSITRAYGYGLTRNPLIATGHPTVRRAVFDKVRWRDDNAVVLGVADDYDFAMECVYYFQKSVILDLALANVRLRSATKASKLKNGRKRAIKYVRRLRGWWNLSFGKI